MGSGYMFRSETSSLGLGFDNYLGFYTVWTVGTVHHKVNNNIFTQNLFDNLSAIDIDLWHDGEDIKISDRNTFQVIYNCLSNLTLTEVSTLDNENDNYMVINLVTDNETLSITLVSDELHVNGKRYHIDKDITRYLTDIAVENHFKNNN